ncbi:MAG: PKD domain-containing protein [Thermoplasmata archaeon]|nr:MAG: PKD domain-containing protein [Thermoplasmata archaeon]
MLRPRIIDCAFNRSNSSWDIQGTFSSNLQVTGCTFEGGSTVPIAMWLKSPDTMATVLVLTNVSVSNYTSWGLQDDHRGSTRMTGCSFTSANISTALEMTDGLTVTDLRLARGVLEVGQGGFSVSDSAFVNASFHAHDNSRGSLLTRCTFEGALGDDKPSVLLDGSLQITVRDLDLRDVAIGFRVVGGSEVEVNGVLLDGATGTAVEVNGSIVRLETCRFRGLLDTGIHVWNVGSRLELRNGTVQAEVGRTGHDVDASNGGDAWLLNTTFNRTSVLSTGAGRVEVLWFVTVEPILPWGGQLWDPDYLAVVDASGNEVVNTSFADGVLRLYELSEQDGVRTMRTPHSFNMSDVIVGVRYSGEHTINASVHLVLELMDVASPVARAGPDQVVNENLRVTLDATSTSDNDPTFHRTGAFRWSFDEYGNQVVLEGDVVTYVFSVPGKFLVNLTVWDLAGNVGSDSIVIQVRDTTPPVIIFTGNVTVDEEEWFIFDASGTTDNDPNFDFTTGTFLWRIEVEGDALVWETPTFGHAFADPGNHSGTVSVWDRAGNMAQESFWVLVMDITAPVIVGVNNATIFFPSDGLLDASQCFDNVGIVSYRWTVLFNNWSGDRDEHTELTGVTPTYSFDRLATYNITLTLSDAAGNVNGTEIWVVYNDVPSVALPSWIVSMAGERVQVPIEVHDVYFTDLRVDVVDGPEDSTIAGPPLTSILVWTPGPEWAGADVTIVVQVHDGFVAAEASIVLHVNNARGSGNQAPAISSTPPLAAKRDTPYIYTVDAEDPDGDVLGYVLVAGPEGMTISPGGTLSWDPPFERGTHMVDVHLRVTDGRDGAEQAWTFRWREPPNVAPLITFELAPVEVLVNEEFLVDLSVYLQGPEAFDVDPDDPNHMLEWRVAFDERYLELVSVEGLLYSFRALGEKGISSVNFTAIDPSAASDTTSMELRVKGRTSPTDGDGQGSMLWLVLAVLVAVGLTGGAVAYSRRGRGAPLAEVHEPEELDLGPTPVETEEKAQKLDVALTSEEPVDVRSFVEVDSQRADEAAVAGAAVGAQKVRRVSRVVREAAPAEPAAFVVEGVAILEANGTVLASTGIMDEVIGPYQDSMEEVRKGLRGDGLAVLELDGHRVLLALRSGVGAMCVIRGREDDGFRANIRDLLSSLFQDRSTEGALSVLEDILASAGPTDTAVVVHDAWTAKLTANLTYQGSVVLLDVRLRNDTDHILNNVRLRLDHDKDALSIQSITPKLLSSHGRLSLGNVPPRKEHKVAVSLVPEICMSSTVRVMVTYTDREGRTVHVPAPTMPVEVECPYIEAGTDMDEERLISMSEKGLGFIGRRVFNYGMDVDHQDLYGIAVGLVVEQGPMKVMDLDDESLMRAEAWFLGSGEGGTPQVLVRESTHGADHMLEIFVTSDDGAVATGLLTYLASEVMDTAASEMPGKRVERVRDAATLEEISVWPSLLDYKIMGE